MSTIPNLILAGSLLKIDAELNYDEQEVRCIYATPRAAGWLTQTLPVLVSKWDLEVTPQEQIADLLGLFCSGGKLEHGRRFHCLQPIGSGIWELKTPDTRLFGFFHRQDCFILTDADDATRVKKVGLYRGYVEQGVRFREALDLDEPKHIEGDKPDDVVTNWREATSPGSGPVHRIGS